jgi:hypothetical protein
MIVPEELNTEIVEREGLAGAAQADDIARPIRHFRTLIDRTARMVFEVGTEDAGVFRFAIPADDFSA